MPSGRALCHPGSDPNKSSSCRELLIDHRECQLVLQHFPPRPAGAAALSAQACSAVATEHVMERYTRFINRVYSWVKQTWKHCFLGHLTRHNTRRDIRWARLSFRGMPSGKSRCPVATHLVVVICSCCGILRGGQELCGCAAQPCNVLLLQAVCKADHLLILPLQL